MVEDEAQETGPEQETVPPDGAGRPAVQPPQGSIWPYRTQPDYMGILQDVTRTLSEADWQEVMELAQLQGGMQPADLQQLLQRLDGASKDQAYVISQKYQLAMWKSLQEAAPEGLPFALPGMAGPQGQQPWLGFNPLPAGGYTSPYPYPTAPTYWGPQPSQGATEQSPQLATLKEELSGMVSSLADQMGALQQRLDRQEAERQRAEEERKQKEDTDRLVNEHRAELKRMEEKQAAALKALKEKLAPQKAPRQDAELAALRKELADLAKSLHDQEIGALRVVMGLQNSAAFPVGRWSPQERATLGEELVKRADKNTALVGDMDKFFAGGG